MILSKTWLHEHHSQHTLVGGNIITIIQISSIHELIRSLLQDKRKKRQEWNRKTLRLHKQIELRKKKGRIPDYQHLLSSLSFSLLLFFLHSSWHSAVPSFPAQKKRMQAFFSTFLLLSHPLLRYFQPNLCLLFSSLFNPRMASRSSIVCTVFYRAEGSVGWWLAMLVRMGEKQRVERVFGATRCGRSSRLIRRWDLSAVRAWWSLYRAWVGSKLACRHAV